MPIDLSVVIPARNEAANLPALLLELQAVLSRDTCREILVVDDGSSDALAEALAATPLSLPLRLLRHAEGRGQSAAVCTGIHAARGDWVVTLDGDGQNDPADIPALLAALAARPGAVPGLVCGQRMRRDDPWPKRLASRVANAVRSRLLGDGVADTGCGLKLIHREGFLRLPHFDHMHRFLPALFIRAGARVVCVPVSHRARRAGQSKYGVLDRLRVGIADLMGVFWLQHRRLDIKWNEVELRDE